MFELFGILVIITIVVSGYNALREMPRSTARRAPVMHRTHYHDTRDTGFGG